ncbi:hypothetical protein RvY_15709-2 [Ramazzottius varieornatus]|uniref:Uncharacterized protein n=1 Tax=Ramazzottius varieornatus TaxID=947166 RepID=A0A1D1VVW5_RAMVA|nr:hypothetical protein RvY_15709-2 [Ramazzottius varieornatus]
MKFHIRIVAPTSEPSGVTSGRLFDGLSGSEHTMEELFEDVFRPRKAEYEKLRSPTAISTPSPLIRLATKSPTRCAPSVVQVRQSRPDHGRRLGLSRTPRARTQVAVLLR